MTGASVNDVFVVNTEFILQKHQLHCVAEAEAERTSVLHPPYALCGQQNVPRHPCGGKESRQNE